MGPGSGPLRSRGDRGAHSPSLFPWSPGHAGLSCQPGRVCWGRAGHGLGLSSVVSRACLGAWHRAGHSGHPANVCSCTLTQERTRDHTLPDKPERYTAGRHSLRPSTRGLTRPPGNRRKWGGLAACHAELCRAVHSQAGGVGREGKQQVVCVHVCVCVCVHLCVHVCALECVRIPVLCVRMHCLWDELYSQMPPEPRPLQPGCFLNQGLVLQAAGDPSMGA